MKKTTLDAWLAAAEAAKQATARNDPGETLEDIRLRTGWCEMTARREIKRLIEQGKVRHSGFRGRCKVYELTKK